LIIQKQETRDGQHRVEPDRPTHIFSTRSTPFQTSRKRLSMRDARRAAQTRQPRYLLTIHRQNKQDQALVGYDRLIRAYRGSQASTRVEGSTQWKSRERSEKTRQTRTTQARAKTHGKQAYNRARNAQIQLFGFARPEALNEGIDRLRLHAVWTCRCQGLV
jgi:hypothetical protein